MFSTNNCQAPSHTEAGSRLVGLVGPVPIPATDPAADAYAAVKVTCTPSFFRDRAADVLDLVSLGKTIEVTLDLAPSAPPIAVVVPWAEYCRFIDMRTKIESITGQMQRAAEKG